jgi:hypothetical protein
MQPFTTHRHLTTCRRAAHLAAGIRASAALTALAALAGAQTPQWISAEQAKLLPTPNGSDNFGRSVAISGDVAVVGAWLNDTAGTNAGAVYVYRRSGPAWSLETTLMPNAPGFGDVFGFSVDVEGNTIVVGAYLDDSPGTDAGSAYIYVWNGASWIQQTVLTGSAGSAGDEFGYDVALHGDLVVIGAPLDDPAGKSDAGSAYVFARSTNGTPFDLTDDTWCEQANLAPAGLLANDQFGTAVAVSPSNDTVAIGAPLDDELAAGDTGSVHLFGRGDNGTPANPCDDTWTQEGAKVLNLSNAAGDHFGNTLAIEDDTLIVGSPYDDHDSVASGDCGSFLVVERLPGPTWVPVTKVFASDFAAGDLFGFDLAMQGDSLVLGSYGDNGLLANNDEGCSYFFRRNTSGAWVQQLKLAASDGAADDFFGVSVDVDGDSVISGSDGDDVYASVSGSAYVHEVQRDKFATFCYGDGSSAPCPCSNNSVAGATQGCKNSLGRGVTLRPGGSTNIAADDLVLYASNIPSGNACVLFAGTSSNSGLPFFAGLKCIPPSTIRLGLRSATVTGYAEWGPGLNTGHWSMGQTWYFQVWYRDPTFTGCMPVKSTNLSNGVQATF